MQPLVSITMSTYNVEAFIKESLDCIVNQTLKNIEIICIDDGSTDNTLAILYEYAKKDNRIKVIAKIKNEGLSVARNEALVLAKGKYIAFVDGDDLIDLNLFEKAFKLAEKNKSELVIWDYITFSHFNDIKLKKQKLSELKVISETDKVALLKRPSFSCIKMIRLDIIRLLEVSFPKGLSRQDVPVNWKLITRIDRISLLPERLYYYRQHSQATTHRTDKRLFDIATVMDIVKTYLIKSNVYETYKDEFLRQRLNLLSGMEDIIHGSLKEKALQLVLERLGEDEWSYVNSKKPLRKQSRDFYLSLQGNVLAKIRRQLWLLSRRMYRSLKGKR